MRLPRPRFTVRQLILAVAAAALLAGGLGFRVRGQRLSREADRHFAAGELGSVPYRDLWGREIIRCRICSLGRGVASRLSPAQREWHALMARRYYEAAERPWLSVEVAPAPVAAR